MPDAVGDHPAIAEAGGCVGRRVARPLGKAAASELARRAGARTSARSAAARRGAEIAYVERHRTAWRFAHRACASTGSGSAYRTHSGADGKIPSDQTAALERRQKYVVQPAARR